MLKANLSLEDEFPKGLQADALAVVNRLLDAEVEVGVVTSILGHLAKKDLMRFGFPVDRFFLIQGADDEPAHKPDPGVFSRALGLLVQKNITPEAVLYVGDALMDYYAARDAGMSFAGVTTGLVTARQFETEGAKAMPSLTKLLSQIQRVPE